jgi:hypothetical protein
MSTRETLRIAAALATLLLCPAAQADLFRAYLSITGNDANPCTVGAPCRLLPAALNAVTSGGEIWMLDSANYNTGPVAIAKSVTILAIPGEVGSLVALGGPAVTIATAGVKVAFRNLNFVPFPGGAGTGGIVMTAGASLSVESSLFAGLDGEAIDVNGFIVVRVVDTMIRDGAAHGIHLRGGSTADIVNTRLLRNRKTASNVFALWVDGSVNGTGSTAFVTDCVFSSNGFNVVAFTPDLATGSARIIVTRTVSSNSQYGILAEAASGGIASALVASSTVVDNGTGMAQIGTATFRSFGNNNVGGNGSDTAGTIAPQALH